MTIEARINDDIKVALRAGDTVKKNILVTIKGEIQTIKKNQILETLSDGEVIKILNRFTKNLNENLKTVNNNNEQDAQELAILKDYYPVMMTEEQITVKIQELIDSGVTNIGGIMAAFKGLFADMKLVSATYNKMK